MPEISKEMNDAFNKQIKLELDSSYIYLAMSYWFKERELEQFSVAKSDRIAWNKDGMHNIDAHQLSENQWIAVMDGYGKEYVYGLRY